MILGLTAYQRGGYAQNQADKEKLCGLRAPDLVQNVSLNPNVPEYFFKPVWPKDSSDKRDEVSVIMGGQNYLVDMSNGSTRKIPGPYDGVPTPDGEFIVAPANGDYIKFFDRDKILPNSSPIYDDRNSGSGNSLEGVYHSLGITKTKTNSDGSVTKTYRGITDVVTNLSDRSVNSLQYKDYTVTINSDGSKVFAPNNHPPRQLCENFTKTLLKTPIISKDGKMLSAYNEETGSTIIYNISVDSTGKSTCTPKKNMGFATSKMEFSPDGKKVVFAMNALTTTPSDVAWYQQPELAKHQMNVYTYDLETNQLKLISSQDQGNAYYPSFNPDGSVTYLSQSVNSGGGPSYSLQRAKTEDAPSTNLIDVQKFESCGIRDPHSIKMFALGKLWGKVCERALDSTASILTRGLAIPKENCKALVGQYWESSRSQFTEDNLFFTDQNISGTYYNQDARKFYSQTLRKLTKDDLLTICDSLKGPTTEAKVGPVKVEKTDAAGETPLPLVSYCTQCHTQGASSGVYIPFDKPSELPKWKRKMLLQVVTGNMPKYIPLAPDDREAVLDAINAIPEP